MNFPPDELLRFYSLFIYQDLCTANTLDAFRN